MHVMTSSNDHVLKQILQTYSSALCPTLENHWYHCQRTLIFIWYINSKTATEAFQRRKVLSANSLASLPCYLVILRRPYSSSAVKKNLSHLKKMELSFHSSVITESQTG